jgi:hypothetical protein
MELPVTDGESGRITIADTPVPTVLPGKHPLSEAEWEEWDRIIKPNRVVGNAIDEGQYRATELIEELWAAGLEKSDLCEWPL